MNDRPGLFKKSLGHRLILEGVVEPPTPKASRLSKKPVQKLMLLQALPTSNTSCEIMFSYWYRLAFFSFLRRLKFIQYRTGVWKCHRSLSPDPSPSTGYNLGTHGCTIFIQYWAGVWQPHRRAQFPPAPALDKNRSPIFAPRSK